MKLRHLLLGSVAALAAAGNANADYTSPSGWYMSLGAGANWLQDNQVSEPANSSHSTCPGILVGQ